MAKKDTDQTLFEGSLRNYFLIAMPGLNDPHFGHSITYICDHSADGAMGLVINKAMEAQLSEVFDQMDIEHYGAVGSTPILAGGPVSTQRGFVLHPNDGEWESSVEIGPNICLTASRDIIHAIADGHGPSNAQFVLGHAGWSAGQLEQEIKDNSWLTVPASTDILFHTPIEQRWLAAAQCLGVDISLMTSTAGHA